MIFFLNKHNNHIIIIIIFNFKKLMQTINYLIFFLLFAFLTNQACVDRDTSIAGLTPEQKRKILKLHN